MKSAKLTWQFQKRYTLEWCTKSNLITISHSYVKHWIVELRFSKMQWVTPCSSSASLSLEQSRNPFTFFDWNRKQMKFYIWQEIFLHHISAKKASKNWLKNTISENIQILSSGRRKNNFKDNSCNKTIPLKFLCKINSRKQSQVIMIAMHKSQTSLHIKTSKVHRNNNLQHQNSKIFEKKICRRVEVVRKLTVKSTTKPQKRFRIKKRGLRYTMSQ